MAYIDKIYYNTDFKGRAIPDDEFDRLAEIASDVIASIATVNISETAAQSAEVKKATAYETEMLFSQGGIDAVVGLADGVAVGSESLGGYSVSNNSGSASQAVMRTKDGIPVSSLALSQLRKAGLMNRWAYAERYKNLGKL